MVYQLCGGLFNAKAIFAEEQQWYYLTYSWWGDKGVHTFPKGIGPKVNTIARLKFELYFTAAVQHFSYYAMGTPSDY